jgi:hypothetical protein
MVAMVTKSPMATMERMRSAEPIRQAGLPGARPDRGDRLRPGGTLWVPPG